jgi:hypothetical protein
MVRLQADYFLVCSHNAVGSAEQSHIFAQGQIFYSSLRSHMMLKDLRNLLLKLDSLTVLDLFHFVVADVQYSQGYFILKMCLRVSSPKAHLR